MATKTIGKCASCSYPLAAEFSGQKVSCPMCGTVNEAIAQSTFSSAGWFIFGLLAGLFAKPFVDEMAQAAKRGVARIK